MDFSSSSQNYEILINSLGLATPPAAILTSFAWAISRDRYSGYKVFSTLKKQSRGGPLSFGNFVGKKDKKSASFFISGHRRRTLSSSQCGTWTYFTWAFFNSCFLPLSTSLRKSLVTSPSSGKQYYTIKELVTKEFRTHNVGRDIPQSLTWTSASRTTQLLASSLMCTSQSR